MSHLHETKLARFYRVVVPVLTNIGAAVVIIGAMFKILHLPGGGPILAAGLVTEAVLFLLAAGAPPVPFEKHYDWELAYPELMQGGEPTPKKSKKDPGKDVATLGAIDKMLAEANLGPEAFKNFGSGIDKLNKSVVQLKDMSNVAAASDEYSRNLQVATKSVGDLNKSFGTATQSMKSMSEASTHAKDYNVQIQAASKHLSALNGLYEMELKDTNAHIKTMNKFHTNMAGAVENMNQASKEAEKFKGEMSKLTTNLTKLNNVYGNMLTAMKG